MNVTRALVWLWLVTIIASLPVGLGGCASVISLKHKVAVDAIRAPGKPTGALYRLVPRRATNPDEENQMLALTACVNAALMGKGMSEAPPQVAPEIFIDVSYGSNPGLPTDPRMRDNFLQLSAKENPGGALVPVKGPEIWNVRASFLGPASGSLPLLAVVAADYVGRDTRGEATIEVPDNSPLVEAVREAAIAVVKARTAAEAK